MPSCEKINSILSVCDNYWFLDGLSYLWNIEINTDMKPFLPVTVLLVILLIAGCKENDEESRTDHTPPEITILGSNPVYTRLDSTYVDAGATAYDNVDGDLTSSIQTTNNVNIHVEGTYTVNYRVSDRAGNIADTNRVVKVLIFK